MAGKSRPHPDAVDAAYFVTDSEGTKHTKRGWVLTKGCPPGLAIAWTGKAKSSALELLHLPSGKHVVSTVVDRYKQVTTVPVCPETLAAMLTMASKLASVLSDWTMSEDKLYELLGVQSDVVNALKVELGQVLPVRVVPKHTGFLLDLG